jgi:hypothetical protein
LEAVGIGAHRPRPLVSSNAGGSRAAAPSWPYADTTIPKPYVTPLPPYIIAIVWYVAMAHGVAQMVAFLVAACAATILSA